ncbi:MAG: phosphoribosyltransferase [Candidatus Abyssobacteria bacterium SURF_5]|uniref:Phosphoribosyltransferase n=1 Tax=Abyssobacteria bacterium (strain SURF_5) TaxID=2093360 RepID=A0A3A4N575_ABYX5|nr:MAG: phosphoribosyltransferase [Candidatus Abyssubacteria bacterium SURF_5]
MSEFEVSAPKYRDRVEAGAILAQRLAQYRDEHPLVLSIPNGGVPVGAVIAERLNARLYLVIARKLQIPDNPEAGFGAITTDGNLILNHALMLHLGLREPQVQRQKERALAEARLKRELFGARADLPPMTGRIAVLVDDGLASGYTMEAAVESVKAHHAQRIIIAVPTSSSSAYRRLHPKVDRIFCPDLSRLPFFAVANAYEKWYDVGEDEVKRILEELEKKGL